MGKNKHFEGQGRGIGGGSEKEKELIDLRQRVGVAHWGDLPESCKVVESDGKLKEISVPDGDGISGKRRVIIVEKK